MIERVNPQNLADFLVLAKRMHAESVYRHLPFNGQKLASFIGNPIIYAALAKRAGAYVGVMMGIVAPDVFSDVPIATEFGLYEPRDVQGGMAALSLVRDFEAWAKEKGAKELRPAVSAGIDDEMAFKFYRKLGYEPLGRTLRKGI